MDLLCYLGGMIRLPDQHRVTSQRAEALPHAAAREKEAALEGEVQEREMLRVMRRATFDAPVVCRR